MKNTSLLRGFPTVILILISVFKINGQDTSSKITFLEEKHDFERIAESGGMATHVFKFINTGTDSVKITSVRASCGCTTPYWQKSALMPGDTGRVEVAYNPLNRPGQFNKTVTIRTSAEPSTKLLRITGYVEPTPKNIEDQYNTELGGIRLKSKFINFGNITNEKAVSQQIEIYNQTEDTINVLDRFVTADFIKVSHLPVSVAPKSTAVIEINYLANINEKLGFMNDPLTIFTDEVAKSSKSLNVIATINEYFPPMTEDELARAPHIEFEAMEYDFGHLDEGDTVSHFFKFSNTGKDTLNIRQTRSTCGCTVSELEQMNYAAGEMGELKVAFDSKGTRGTQIKRITLFSNDPTAPTQDLIIKAYVRDN